MSLLLDALKKNGATQTTDSNGRPTSAYDSELSLQEPPVKPSTPPPINVASAWPGTPVSTSARSAGENLFAAKKAPARKKFNYTLGIIPTALIIGGVLGTAGAIYVWIEIQPPKAVLRNNPAVAAYTAPAFRPAPPLALPPEKLPELETKPKTSPRVAAPLSERSLRPRNVKRAPATQPAAGIQIQRKLEDDGIYTTLMAAYQAYQNGDMGTAWQRYREVLQMDTKNRDALLGMAAIAQQQGQDDAALKYYRQVLILDPRDPAAQAGMSAFSTVDSAGKESQLKQSLAQTPQSAALHFALGNLYAEQSRWGDAQEAYYNAMRLEPANALFVFSLATSLDHLGQGKLAAQYYGQALQLDTTGNSGFDRAKTQQRMNQLLAT